MHAAIGACLMPREDSSRNRAMSSEWSLEAEEQRFRELLKRARSRAADPGAEDLDEDPNAPIDEAFAIVKRLFAAIPTASPEQRAILGKRANGMRAELEGLHAELRRASARRIGICFAVITGRASPRSLPSMNQ